MCVCREAAGWFNALQDEKEEACARVIFYKYAASREGRKREREREGGVT
jgi:hypothetical protein